VLDAEQFEDAVLVGHSDAGIVITGVADRALPAPAPPPLAVNQSARTLLGEVKRRTKVMGRFPGEESCLTLVWGPCSTS
jgi:hypothetical protein